MLTWKSTMKTCNAAKTIRTKICEQKNSSARNDNPVSIPSTLQMITTWCRHLRTSSYRLHIWIASHEWTHIIGQSLPHRTASISHVTRRALVVEERTLRAGETLTHHAQAHWSKRWFRSDSRTWRYITIILCGCFTWTQNPRSFKTLRSDLITWFFKLM